MFTTQSESIRLTKGGENQVTCAWFVLAVWRNVLHICHKTLGRILTGSGHPALTTCNISFFYQPSLWGQINVRYVTIRRCYVLDKEEVWCDGGIAASEESEKLSDIVIVVQIIRHCGVWRVAS